MALTIFDPRTKAYRTFTTPNDVQPLDFVVLLNVLIELQAISVLLSSIANGTPADDPATIRTDITSVT